jgi:hypothetical protein
MAPRGEKAKKTIMGKGLTNGLNYNFAGLATNTVLPQTICNAVLATSNNNVFYSQQKYFGNLFWSLFKYR